LSDTRLLVVAERRERMNVHRTLLLAVAAILPYAAAGRPAPAQRTTTTGPGILEAANAFLTAVGGERRAAVTFAFDNPLRRTGWSNLPTGIFKRNGLRLGDLTPTEQAAALNLVAAALSPAGYQKVTDIMNADEALNARGGGRTGGRPGQGGVRSSSAAITSPSTSPSSGRRA
jgi:uncharacterized protein DUF3500